MRQAKERQIDHYIERVKAHLLKKFPYLQLHVEKWSDREATIFYTPYSEEEEWPIIHRSGGIATDALVDGGFRIYVMPDRVTAASQTSQ